MVFVGGQGVNSLRSPAHICSALGKLCLFDILQNDTDSLPLDVRIHGLNRMSMSIVHCVHIGLILSLRISVKFIAYETLARREKEEAISGTSL